MVSDQPVLLCFGIIHVQILFPINFQFNFYNVNLGEESDRSVILSSSGLWFWVGWIRNRSGWQPSVILWWAEKAIIFSFLFLLLLCLVAVLAPLGLYINAKQQHWCTNAYILNWYSFWSLYYQISPSWQADSVRNVKWLGDSLVQ